jgi:hypothetical protein
METTVYGECIGARDAALVRICDLANEGCALEADLPETVLDSEFTLWIGAIGPISATASRSQEKNKVAVRFKEPLDGRILKHFNCG